MHSTSAMLLRHFMGWAVLVAIAPFSSVSANANPISEAGSEQLSPSVGFIQSEMSVAESAQQPDAARLERQGFLALQRFEAGEQLAALRLALQAGEQLSDRVSPGQPLADYPALIPVLALQTILDTIHEVHQIQLTQPFDQVSQSPDGAVLATLGHGKGIQLWDWSGQLRHTLSGQYGMSFSANGAYIAAITIDDNQNSTIRVWDVTTGEQVTQFQEDSFVFRVALSPDGQQIFTQRIESSTLELWNLSGQPIGQIDHQHFIEQILFSPDGQWFAIRSGDQAVSVWTMAGAEIARLETITSLDFSPDGEYLFIAQDSGVIQRINQAGVMQPVMSQAAAVRQIRVSPQGDRIAVITDAGRVELLDIAGESMGELPGSDVYFSPDGAWVITTTDDGTIWFRDPIAQFNAQLVGEFENPSIHFNDDSSRMLIVDQDTAQLWNIAGTRGIRDGAGVLTEADLRKLTEFAIVTSSSQNAPILSPDLARIATVRSPQTISLWMVNSPGDRFKLPLPYDIADFYQADSLRFTPDAEQLIVNDDIMWSLTDETLLARGFSGYQHFSSDGRYLAEKTDRNALLLKDLVGDRTLAELAGTDATFSPDNQILVSIEATDTFEEQSILRVWDVTGQRLGQFNVPFRLPSFTFMPDGRGFAVEGLNSNQVFIWTPSGAGEGADGGAIALEHTASGCCLGISVMALSPDGQILATANEQGSTVKLWNLNGQEIGELSGHQQVGSITISPDSQRIVTTDSRTGTIHIWNRDGQHVARLAEGSQQFWQIEFTPDEQTFLAISRGGGSVILANWSGEQLRRVADDDSIADVRFSPNRRQVAIANSVQDMTSLWMIDGETIATLPGGTVAFSADSQQLATGSNDGTVRRWTPSGREIISFVAHDTRIDSLALSPDGQRLATGSADGQVRLWTAAGDLVGEWNLGDSSGIYRSTPIVAIAFSDAGEKLAAINGENRVGVWQVGGLSDLLQRGRAWLQTE